MVDLKEVATTPHTAIEEDRDSWEDNVKTDENYDADDDDDDDDEECEKIKFDNKIVFSNCVAIVIERKVPRIYNFTLYVIIPLLMMIGICFFCGFIVAKFERPYAIESNNDILKNFYNEKVIVESIVPSIEKKYEECLARFVNEFSTTDTLISFMDDCTRDEIQLQKETAQNFVNNKLQESHTESLSFSFVKCEGNVTKEYVYVNEQSKVIYSDWLESYEDLKNKHILNGLSSTEAHDRAIAEADGSKSCELNIGGSAMFWWTVMTTIGYGNATPASIEGRLMVYFLGSISIFFFCVITAHGGYIVLIIADHFFCYLKLRKLAEGITAVIFWLVMFILWMLMIAWLFVLIRNNHFEKFGYISKFGDGMWFAFISVTTVGLGDIYVSPDLSNVSTVFQGVFIISLGFTVYANFWLKLSSLFVGSELVQKVEKERYGI